MKSNAVQQQTIREYLLGRIAVEEREKLEEQLLIDTELYEELLVSEDELVDEYLRDDLSGADREDFESHFFAAPEHQEKVRFARAFRKYVAVSAAAAVSADVGVADQLAVKPDFSDLPPKRGLFSSFLPFQNPIVSYSALAALVLMLTGIGWVAWKNLSNPASTGQGEILAVTLTPGFQRSEGETKRFAIRSGVGTIRLQLLLPGNQYQSYEATVQDFESRAVATKSNLKPTSVDDNPAVFVDLNPSQLTPGDYVIKLSGVPPGGDSTGVASYSFRVLNQ